MMAYGKKGLPAEEDAGVEGMGAKEKLKVGRHHDEHGSDDREYPFITRSAGVVGTRYLHALGKKEY